jgi:5-methyltetrahydrofolate--homocysteine methyltransferase
MQDRQIRLQALEDALATRVLVLDGAMGTMLQDRHLTAADFGGPALEGCNEHLVLTRPNVVRDIHKAYFAAGSDMVETNTFGSSPVVLAEFGIADQSYALSRAAAEIARQAAGESSTPGHLRFVAGSMGPTTKAITVTGGITFPELIASYLEQARGLIDGGADVLLLETCNDTRTIKAGLIAINRLRQELGIRIPVMVSGTIEPMGTMLAGQAADAFYVSIAHADLLSVGLNCGTGPEFMTDHVRSLHELATTRVSCYPNAGLPDAEGAYLETPETVAAHLERFIDHGWLNIVGGCCGTRPEHIRAISEMTAGKQPRAAKQSSHRSYFSGIDVVEAEESSRPLIVGERTNVIGSRLFKKMIAEEKWEEASEIARWQIRNGAHIVDVCLQSSDRDEFQDIPPFYDKVIRKIKAPVMIDTTDARAIELSLTYCQGKSIINSVNLEDGEE